MEQLFVNPVARVGDLYVAPTRDAALVRRLINTWHSFRRAPRIWSISFILTDGVCVYGVSIFAHPVARNEDQIETLEHSRMALAPNAPRNSASFFMARSRQWIAANMPHIRRLISYVPSGEWSGVTYRADNWRTVYTDKAKSSSWSNKSRPRKNDFGCARRTKFEFILKEQR